MRCFLDDEFLLRFLRHSKYSLVRATEELKCYLSCPKLYPECFGSFDVHEPKFSAILETNFLLITPEVDADGCLIAILHMAYLETENVSFVDVQRLFFTFQEIAANMEEVQGLKLILDHTNVSMKLYNLFSLQDYRRISLLLKKPFWCPLKACYILNLPSFGVHIANFLLKFASEKMRNRYRFVSDKHELKNYMDVNLLLEEYGGKVSIEEYRNYLKEFLDAKKDIVLLLNEIDADFEDIERETSDSPEFDFGPTGSFKKLEID
jgi:hypothetical protein